MGVLLTVAVAACGSTDASPPAVDEAPVGSRFSPGDESSPPIDELCDLNRLARFDALVWARPAAVQSEAFGDDFVQSFDIEIDEVIVQPRNDELAPGSTITISTYSTTPGTFQGTAVGQMWVDTGSESVRVVALHPDSYQNSRYMARGFDFDDGVSVYPGCESDVANLVELGERVGIDSELDLLVAMQAEGARVDECVRSGDETCPSSLAEIAERVSRGMPEPVD